MRKVPPAFSAQLGLAGASLIGAQDNDMAALAPMLSGIKRYQESAYKAELPMREILWQSGSASLQKTIPQAQSPFAEHVCVLVPSLINSAVIMDLCAERSLARWLEGQGISTCVLDWGPVAEDEEITDLQSLIAERLIPALAFMKEKLGRPVQVMGYCMGGTITMGAASLRPDLFKSLVLLATPWDFLAGSGLLASRVKFFAPTAVMALAERPSLPASWLQTLFATLDPLLAHKKFSRFAGMSADSEEERIFIAIEDWLSSGSDLPRAIALECILGWFTNNAPVNGEWMLGGKPVNPAEIDVPALVIASKNDKLVEFESSAPLCDLMPDAALLDPGCGHVGMIAGRRSVPDVWAPMAEWIKRQ